MTTYGSPGLSSSSATPSAGKAAAPSAVHVSEVILVDDADAVLGTAGKKEVHVSGRLHRAFSVFLVDDTGRHLLQRRAEHKYHSGGLWSNACCSHPRPGESTEDAARRRLMEELGVRVHTEPAFHMRYRAPLPGGHVEHEYDHIFIGRVDASMAVELTPDASEVSETAFVDRETIEKRIRAVPESFTRWFVLAWPEVCRHLESDRPEAARSVFCPDGAVATFLYPQRRSESSSPLGSASDADAPADPSWVP